MTKPGLWYIIYNDYKLVSISNPHIFQAKPTSFPFSGLIATSVFNSIFTHCELLTLVRTDIW